MRRVKGGFKYIRICMAATVTLCSFILIYSPCIRPEDFYSPTCSPLHCTVDRASLKVSCLISRFCRFRACDGLLEVVG